jgi:flagellin-like protein
MAWRVYANKRGISPVVATVILVAVTIVVAVAVAYWMGGLTSIYTRFEKLEITSIYAEYLDSKWNITIALKNTGTADATIDNILLNGKPYTTYNNVSISSTIPISVKVGQSTTITISILEKSSVSSWPFQHGVSVEVRLHSAAGQEYPKTVTLP